MTEEEKKQLILHMRLSNDESMKVMRFEILKDFPFE